MRGFVARLRMTTVKARLAMTNVKLGLEGGCGHEARLPGPGSGCASDDSCADRLRGSHLQRDGKISRARIPGQHRCVDADGRAPAAAGAGVDCAVSFGAAAAYPGG